MHENKHQYNTKDALLLPSSAFNSFRETETEEVVPQHRIVHVSERMHAESGCCAEAPSVM